MSQKQSGTFRFLSLFRYLCSRSRANVGSGGTRLEDRSLAEEQACHPQDRDGERYSARGPRLFHIIKIVSYTVLVLKRLATGFYMCSRCEQVYEGPELFFNGRDKSVDSVSHAFPAGRPGHFTRLRAGKRIYRD